MEGDALQKFKKELTISKLVSSDSGASNPDAQISKHIRSLILWTERGAARHAKMLETDAAWDVFEALEDHYFRRSQAAEEEEGELSTVRDREPLLYAAVAIVVKHRLPFHVVYQTINHFAGSARFSVMTKSQVSEVAQFVERFLIGNDTRRDWARIEANRKGIAGDGPQPELLGFVIPGTLGGGKLVDKERK